MYMLSRETTVRKPINQYGRLGYVKVVEWIVTENPEAHQKGKRIKYDVRPMLEDEVAEFIAEGHYIDKVYRNDIEIVSRHAGSRYMRGH